VGLPSTRETDEQDVALLNDHIKEIGVGDDPVGNALVPVIHDPLEVVRDARGEPPLGEILADHELIEVTDGALGVGMAARRACLDGHSAGGVGSGAG
jgi:hypothetical protein